MPSLTSLTHPARVPTWTDACLKRAALAVSFGLLLVAFPAAAAASVAPSAASEARQRGFDAREALGPDVSLVERGRGKGLFRVRLRDGQEATTHGPDLRNEVEDHGTALGPGDPERAPFCADTDYQHVLYAVPSGQTDRSATVAPEIRAAIRRMNAVLDEESRESGGPQADYRILCDPAGEIRVDTFTAPAGDDSLSAIVNAAEAAGFDRPATKYTIFYDGGDGSSCGVGYIYDDDWPGPENLNNTEGSYGVTYDDCWYGSTPMHENAHNMGAVQRDAPNSTGSGWHCNQAIDVMCYSPDGGDRNQDGTVLDCPGRLHFDCGQDDYFDTTPEEGEYLQTHWNIGSPVNRFLNFTAAPEPDNSAPSASDDTATVEKDTARDLYPLANDSDPEGDWLRIAAAANPAHGTAMVAADRRSVRYTPDPGYVGWDSFTYAGSDGLGGEDSGTVTIAVRDTIPPRITRVSPVPLSKRVNRLANLTATFSEPMWAATLNRTTVRLVRNGTTSSVRATVRYDAAGRRAILDPRKALVRGATYRAVVTTGVRDRSGNRLPAAKRWSFRVRR